jgi:hypothetical protein
LSGGSSSRIGSTEGGLSEPIWTLRDSERSSVFGTGCGFSNGKVAPQALFSGNLRRLWPSENVTQLDYVRQEIERMRAQVHRQRGEIRQLQRAGISTGSAEALLERMLNKIDELCAERDRLKSEQGPVKGRVLGGRSW